jgi:uncharacterized protein YrrD
MIRNDEIVGKPVIDIEEGREVGTIRLVTVDVEKRAVDCFLLDDREDGKVVLRIADVETIGEERVLVSSTTRLRSAEDLSGIGETVSFGRNVLGKKVVTQSGESVGEIDAFSFDRHTGAITHYVVSSGTVQDFVEGRRLLPDDGVLSFDDDLVLVTDDAMAVSELMKSEPGIKHQADAAGYKVEAGLRKAIEKAEKFLNR